MKNTLVGILFVMLFISQNFGEIRRVPQQYCSIQTAIDSCRSGDTVFVSNGKYYETITVRKSITLIGESTENTCISWSSDTNFVWNYTLIVDSAKCFTIRNITVKNTYSHLFHWGGSTVQIKNSDSISIISSNIFAANGYNGCYMGGWCIPSHDGGDAVVVENSRNVTIDTCILKGGLGGKSPMYDRCPVSYGRNGYSILALSNSEVSCHCVMYNYRYKIFSHADETSKITDATGVKESNAVLSEFRLEQNYPNPFNPSTTIMYNLPEKAYVTLKVYDVLGNEVSTLVKKEEGEGVHSVIFYGDGLSSGVYFYCLNAGKYMRTKKFLLVK